MISVDARFESPRRRAACRGSSGRRRSGRRSTPSPRDRSSLRASGSLRRLRGRGTRRRRARSRDSGGAARVKAGATAKSQGDGDERGGGQRPAHEGRVGRHGKRPPANGCELASPSRGSFDFWRRGREPSFFRAEGPDFARQVVGASRRDANRGVLRVRQKLGGFEHFVYGGRWLRGVGAAAKPQAMGDAVECWRRSGVVRTPCIAQVLAQFLHKIWPIFRRAMRLSRKRRGGPIGEGMPTPGRGHGTPARGRPAGRGAHLAPGH